MADAAPQYLPKRDTLGRYDYEKDWDRLCVCGHSLGVHAAGSPADCLLHSFANLNSQERREHVNAPPANCGCERFRPKRSKGKFVYLQKPST
jgi:hypothetical protein